MTVDAKLLRLLYDPVGWADPAWLVCFGIDARWPRRLGNHLLLRRADVHEPSRLDLDFPGAAWLIENWGVLPELAYLSGACLLRKTLLGGNALLRLRHGAQRFVALPSLADGLGVQPFCRPLSVQESQQDLHNRVLMVGTLCLRAAWPTLTPAWSDRLRLRLPLHELDATAPADHGCKVPSCAGCLRLLNHAVTFYHAKKH